jgi:hypothetical protein
MKIVLIVVIGLVVVIGILALIGSLLPREHQASSRITLSKPAADVWAVVRNFGALQGTWKDLKSAHRLPDEGGKEVWKQSVGGFATRLLVEEDRAPSHLITRIDAPPDAPFGGKWIYELQPAGGGTQVTVTEDGYVSNPIFRVMMHLMGVHRSADAYLRALGSKFGETVKPVHVGRAVRR